MNVRISKLLHLILLSTVLTACGGGNSGNNNSTTLGGGNTGTNSQTGLPNNLNGLLAFDTERPAYGPLGIFVFGIKGGSIIPESIGKITEGDQGESPYAYDRNTIIYAKRCDGTSTHHVKAITSSGLASSLNITTPCTSTFGARNWPYEVKQSFLPIKVAKLSQDRKKVAITVELSLENGKEGYTIIVYNINTGEEVSRYPKYASPEWLADGRLLLTPNGDDAVALNGIYITDTQLSGVAGLTRIDKKEISTHIESINLNPTGKQLVFSMAGNIWMMDIDGENLKKIIAEKHDLVYPTWSPDGRYIAYLSTTSGSSSFYLQKITFFDTITKSPFVFDLKHLTAGGPDNESYIHLEGPLSWVK